MGLWFRCLNGYGIGGGIGMMFLGIILIGVIIYFLVKSQNHNHAGMRIVETKSSNALEIAKARFTKGEITEEEYRKMKQVLSEDE